MEGGEKDKRGTKETNITRQKEMIATHPVKGKQWLATFCTSCASSVPSRRIWVVEWSGSGWKGSLCPDQFGPLGEGLYMQCPWEKGGSFCAFFMDFFEDFPVFLRIFTSIFDSCMAVTWFQ